MSFSLSTFAILAGGFTALFAPHAFAAAEADLLVGYDQSYASANGGTAQTRVIIANAVAGSNAINERSGTPQRIRIVGYHEAAQYSYQRTSNGGFVNWMSSYDSRLADVTNAGDARGADLVTFICESTADGAGAVANQPGRYSSFDPAAFWATVVAHEIGGHNYGCDHRDGHANPKTVMLHNYCGGGAQGWFSNSNIWLNGSRLVGGDSCLGAGPNGGDNSAVIAASAQGVADRFPRVAVAPRLGNVVRRWTYTQAAGNAPSGTTVTDSVTGTAVTTVQGTGAAFTGSGLRIPGGTSASGAAYLQLPAGVISGYTHVTVEIWATPLSVQNWARLMDFNNGTSNYIMLSSALGTDLDTQRFSAVVNGAIVTRDSSLPSVAGVPHHYALTYTSTGTNTGRWTWFRDGDEVCYLDVAQPLSAYQDVNNWLGRSAFGGDARAHCEYAEVRISNVAMSRDEILANFELGPNRAGADSSLTADDPLGSASFNSAGRWSDGLAPSAGKSYETYSFRLRSPADGTSRTFGGQSLRLTGGGLTWKGTSSNTITVNNLSLRGNAEVLHAGSGTWTLAGNFNVESDDTMVRAASGNINLTTNLGGSKSLLFVDDTTTLGGSNAGFTGRIVVGDGRSSSISIDAETRLGPNPASLVSNHLTFNRGTLQTAGSITLDDPNRGILFDVNGGTFNVTSGTLTLACPLSSPDNAGNPIVGALRKSGAGTLILNSTSSTFNGNFHVDGGGNANDGVVRVMNNQVLANAHNPIFIENTNAGRSTLQLDGTAGPISLTRVQLASRSNTTPAIQNLSGTNNIGGLTVMSGGSNHIVQCDNGLLNFTGSIYSGVTGDRTITFQGAGDIASLNTISELSATTVSVLKLGTGTLTLAGACSHDGTTTLSGGTLRINGSLTTAGTMTTAAGTRFAGTGTSNAVTTIAGTHAPGNATNSTGTQTFSGALTYHPGSNLAWTLVSNSVAAASSSRAAAQSVTVTSGANLNLVFNGPGSSVDFTNSFWSQTRSWTVLTSTAMGGQFSLGTVSADSLGRLVAGYGSFLLQQSATGVTVTYYPLVAAPPPAPAGLTSAGWPGAVALAWSPASGATSYNIRRSNHPGGPYDIVATGVTGTGFSDISVSNDLAYCYVVNAVNAFGEGGESVETSATPHLPAVIDKANNPTNLSLAGSWANGILPNAFDTARWTGLTGSNSVPPGANIGLHGISIGSTGGAVTIGPGNTLTLGSNGIDMGAATQNLTISSGLALATGHQIWDIATGRTLTTTGTLTRGAGSTLLIDTSLRSGTVAGTSFNNASGIVGPWAFVKSSGAPANNLGNGHTFATKDLGGNLVPYTAATPQTSTGAWGGIASGGDGTLNCDISSSAAVLGTTGLNRNLNTLRYTGSGARQPGNNAGDLLTLNGLMNAGTGPFTIGRNGANITNDFSFGILIGASNELVLAPLSADIVLYGFIKDGAGGAGTVTIAGNNTVTFGGSNTFTGGLHLNSGTLQLGNDTALGSGTLRVNGGGIRATGAPRTVGNNMVLDGAFTLGRGTNFSGPVALLRDISITSANPDLQAAATSAISGVISGAYRITFNEAANPIGTIVLSGANTHGGTTLNGGILQVGNAGALGASTGDLVVNGGTLDLNAFNPTVRSLSGAGGVISNLASGASLLTTRSALDSVFAGSLQDGAAGKPLALTKQGTGTLNLTGTNTYSGLTTVLAGTVLVNGSLGTASTVTIASGATLGGTGAVGGSATINGTHRPGTGAGTQAFGGTLNYGSSSTLKWDLVSNGTSFAAFDRVVASGAVSVANGAKLDVSFAAPGSGVAFNDAFWTRARSWTLLTGSSVVGNFTLNTFTNDPSGRALADYGTLALQQNGTSVTLLFTPLHTPFELWCQTYFGADWDNPAVAGDPVDGDRDGLVNLMEYALGTDPRIADPGVLQGSTDGGKLGISFTRNTAAADLTISVKAADDLSSTWTEIARSENGAAFTATAPGASVNESGGGAIKSVQATDIHLTNDPDHPKRFMRVTAQSNP